jgi:hypothetical protein
LIAIIILIAPNAVNAAPIPLYDHSFRSFDGSDTAKQRYRLTTPQVSELWSVHNIALQFSDRYYYSNDTSLTANRALFYFADSINFRDIDFNLRIRLDAPGGRVRDAGWTSARAGAANDPGFVYDPDRMVAYYAPSERARFGFGKERVNYGPLELGGLLLSDYNEGFTGFYQRYALGSFVLSGLTAQLNSMAADPVDKTLITHRYFSASRLQYYKPDYGFALGQSIIYAGVGRSFELSYFLPFYIFHYGQMTDVRGYGNDGQNTKGSLDGYCKVYRLPIEVYGELLIDDFQAHGDSLSRSAQNSAAWMAGVRLRGEAAPWYGFAEGGRVSTYTYNHKLHPKRYLLNDCLIGSPIGPDQQLFWGKIGRSFYGGALRADANFWLRRSGERGIGYDYSRSDIFGTANDPQPYGIVEDELSLWQSASYRAFYVEAEARGGATLYKNRGNSASGWAAHPFFGLFLSSGIFVNADRPGQK